MSGTVPEKLRRWAENRERLGLYSRLLRQAASEIEEKRKRVKDLERGRSPSS
jgi:hypothetical protein